MEQFATILGTIASVLLLVVWALLDRLYFYRNKKRIAELVKTIVFGDHFPTREIPCTYAWEFERLQSVKGYPESCKFKDGEWSYASELVQAFLTEFALRHLAGHFILSPKECKKWNDYENRHYFFYGLLYEHLNKNSTPNTRYEDKAMYEIASLKLMHAIAFNAAISRKIPGNYNWDDCASNLYEHIGSAKTTGGIKCSVKNVKKTYRKARSTATTVVQSK